jgi:hypothetical protein
MVLLRQACSTRKGVSYTCFVVGLPLIESPQLYSLGKSTVRHPTKRVSLVGLNVACILLPSFTDDDDIVMPAGPPPAGFDEPVHSDDEIVMPDDPPPTAQGFPGE